MKKTVVLILFLVLCLSLSAAADGLPAGWYSLRGDGVELFPFFLPYGSSVSVPDSMELLPYDTISPFTAAPGMYSVPADVPAGVYSFRCDDASSWCIVTIRDANDDLVISQVLHSDTGTYVAKVELSEGGSLKVENGSARFEPPRGIIFDSPSDSASAEKPSKGLHVNIPKSSLVDAAESAVEEYGMNGE